MADDAITSGPSPARGTTDYATYLRIDDLLRLQHPLTAHAHDELLFIVVHQAYELWFRLILHELDAARDALLGGDPPRALAPLRRTVMVEQLLLDHLRLLETMSPEGFMEFRDPLAPASGFQSTQFREIELLSGGGRTAVIDSVARSDDQRHRLEQRRGEPSLWAGLVNALVTVGRIDEESDDAAVLAALATLYRDHRGAEATVLHAVCELLLDHDENIARWRHDHALMAGREIGRRPGTGGSQGVSYLEGTIDQRFFPLLWQVRNEL